MADDIPDEFDVVVIGTDMTLSIVAGALSRIGKRVLHIDDRPYYGGDHATLTLDEMVALGEPAKPDPFDIPGPDDAAPADPTAGLDAGAELVPAVYRTDDVDGIERISYVPDTAPAPVTPAPVSPAPVTADAASTDAATPDAATNSAAEHAPDANAAAADDAEAPPAIPPKEASAAAPAAAAAAAAAVTEEPTPAVAAAVPASAVPVPVESMESLLRQSRRYAIDMLPKLCFARGKMINLLITSNIGKYIEFKVAGETFIHMGGSIRQVPCSKQTLLLNRTVSPKEKRSLMKFLTFCSKPPATAVTTVTTTTTTTTADGAATAGSADMTVAPGSAAAAAAAATEDDGLALPFGEYLASKWGFKEETSKFIIFAIAGKTASDVASECTEAIRRYFVSIGVYGKTPFIYPLYGTAEITQAFCRLSAVFGGIYVLRQKIGGFAVADGKCTGIVMNGQYIKAGHVVTGHRCLPESVGTPGKSERVARAVLITSGSVVAGNTDAVSAICIPPNTVGNPGNINVLCFSSDAAACPKGKYLVQLTAPATGTAKADLEGAVAMLTVSEADAEAARGAGKPRLLWASYFSQAAAATEDLAGTAAIAGLVVARPAGLTDLHFQNCVSEAERLYAEICPTEAFLPPAPNPEDVVWSNPEPEPEEPEPEDVDRIGGLEAETDAMVADADALRARLKSVQDRATAVEAVVGPTP